MASLHEPDFRSLSPGSLNAARMGTAASSNPGLTSGLTAGMASGLTPGLTRDLPQESFEPPEPNSHSMASQASYQPGSQALSERFSDGAPPPQRIPRWLVRMELFLRVILRLYIGLLVCYAPWWPAFWDQNPLFAQFPALSVYAANGAVRGIVTGLGLLNLWFAFQDALRHREG